MPRKQPNLPPDRDWLLEHFNFAPDGTVTLKKRAYRNDDRPIGSVIGSPNTKKDQRLRAMFQGKDYLLGRIVFYATHGWMPDVLDHIDRNPLNNAPENLRPATYSENKANAKKYDHRPMTSRFKGVYWHKHSKRWRVVVKFQGKKYHIGYFATEEEAYEAYCKAAVRIHGEHACLI